MVEKNPAPRRFNEPVNATNQGRFPCPRGTDESYDLAGQHHKRDAPQRFVAGAIALAQLFDPEHRGVLLAIVRDVSGRVDLADYLPVFLERDRNKFGFARLAEFL